MIKAGFDIGGSSVKTVILKEGKIIKLKLPSYRNFFSKTLNGICGYAEENKIQSFSIACPGPLDFKKGVIKSMPNFKGAKNFNVFEFVKKKRVAASVKLINDANAFALGEYERLKEKYENVIGITVGTGIGGGIITNKKIYTGAGGFAGEFGHIVINQGGKKCGCGGAGCFEAYAGEAHFFKGIKSFSNFYELYTSESAQADKLINLHTDYLACGIASIINILSPEAVIIGGAVVKSYGRFSKRLKREIIKRVFNKKVKIYKASLGEFAGAFGALAL